MPPPAGGGLVLSNEHDNGKTCRAFYRNTNNINRLNRILEKIPTRSRRAEPAETHRNAAFAA
jgi:hypothetical protein